MPNTDAHEVAASQALREKAVHCVGSLPPFSPILTRLVASLANEDVSFDKLADLIEKDTVVAGGVLHLVNSALYARRGTISSVRHALSLLGFSKLRNAVLGMSVATMWNKVRTPPTWSMARFNMHASATATLSDLLAQKLHADYPEGAFVAGLLHDVGRLLIAIGLPQEHERIVRLRQNDRPLVDCEMEVLGFTHASLSEAALDFWNLPAPIRAAVREHHIVAAASNGNGKLTLARVVAAADQYVHCQGTGIIADNARADHARGLMVQEPLMIEGLGLEAQGLETILGEFKNEFEGMSTFFH